MNLFESMRDFARQSKTVRLAAPKDIISEIPHWSDEQLAKSVSQRGEPARVELEIRPGASTMDFEIHPLSMTERETADSMLDAATPDQIFIEESAERPGQLPKRVPAGYDYEAPVYLAHLRPLQERQAAFVVLCGVNDLFDATPGADYAAKTSSLMAAMPNRIVKFLAGEIWNMTYAQGDPADFFTKREDSPASQSSAPSPSPSLPPKKRK